MGGLLRVCPVPGCPALTTGGRCPTHTPKVSAHGWANSTQRVRGRRLQTLRQHLFANEPLCRICARQGLTTVATIRDHIIPLAEGGTDEPTNIQPLCRACSDLKTHQEAKRGALRSR